MNYTVNGQVDKPSLVDKYILLAKTHSNVFYFSPEENTRVLNDKKLLTMCVDELYNKAEGIGPATYYIRKYYEPLCLWKYYSIGSSANPEKLKLGIKEKYLSYSKGKRKNYNGYQLDSLDNIKYELDLLTKKEIELNIDKLILDDTLLPSLGFYMPLFQDSAKFHQTVSISKRDLIKKVQLFNSSVYLKKHTEVANISDYIYAWSILKLFYPYQDKVKINWNTCLKKSLNNILVNHKTAEQQIQLLLSEIKDGHGRYFKKRVSNQELYSGPFKIRKKNERFFIYNSLDQKFQDEDEILSIDGENIVHLYKKSFSEIAGSPQWRNFITTYDRLSFHNKGTLHDCVIKRGTEIKKLKYIADYPPKYSQEANLKHLIKDQIAYFNLNLIDFDFFRKKMDSINEYKQVNSIVFDLRFYPNHELVDFISSITKDTIYSDNFISPKIMDPYSSRDISFIGNGIKEHWTITPSAYRINKPVYFLISSGSQSYSESIISMVKENNLGTLIGERTAGCNGDMGVVILPSNNLFYFTTRYTQTQSKSCYFINGIEPDIYVKNINTISLEKILNIVNE